MKLIDAHATLVQQLGEMKVNFPALAARLGSSVAAQRAVDAVGVRLIDLEERIGITEGRRILEHERTFLPDLPMFQRIARDYAPAPDAAHRIADGTLTEALVEQHAEIVRGAKEALARIERMSADVKKRRAKLSPEALAIAAERDVLSEAERENFSRHHLNTRAERASTSHLQKILEPATV